MKTCPCHLAGKHEAGSGGDGPRLLRRGAEVAGWVLPGLLLALMPKCPVCLAAYVSLATGISLSLPVAGSLRVLLLVLCAASLVILACLSLRRRLGLRSRKGLRR